MIQRTLIKSLQKRLFKGKALIIFGARQTGISTLAEILLTIQKKKWLILNGDDASHAIADLPGVSRYFRLNQFSILISSNLSKSLILSVTKVSSFSTAVTPIKRSNSSCIGVPIFLSRTFSLA